MRFVYPFLLLLLSLVPLIGMLWLWLYRRAQRRLAMLIAPTLQPKLVPAHSTSAFYAQFSLVMIGLTLLVFAAARPQWGRKDEKVFTRGRNLMIALDVSRSMLATDVHPNRLERAKADIMDLIDDLKGDRAALLAFRSKGSLLCPLTTDYAFLRQALDGVSPESAPRGETNLGDAIRKSLEALDPAFDEYNAILLISDGEDLKGEALEAAAESARRNIPIFTVGIGDETGATIPGEGGLGVQQFKGSAVKTRLMSETLTAIADASGGRYVPLGTAGTAHTTLGAIYRRYLLPHIAAKDQQEQIENRYQERYQLFLIPALLCLLAAASFSRGRFKGSRTRTAPASATTAAAIIVLLVISAGRAQTDATSDPSPESSATNRPPVVVAPGRAGAREAQALLRKGRHTEAAEAFLSAARGADLQEAEEYRYNAAYAYYTAQDMTNAVQTLRPLLASRKSGARAGELLGLILMEQASAEGAGEDPQAKAKALEEAAVAFQRALRDTPQDERRDRNLTRAVAPLAEARENAHIAEVLEKHGQTPPDQLLGTLLAEQRALLEESATLHTNDAPTLIAKAEALAERQQQQADLWIPLKQQMLQAVTNAQQQAMVAQQIELARDSMKGAAVALEDLLPEAANETAQIEPLVYNFWKAVAPPNAAIDEDILCQSNALHNLKLKYLETRDSQAEALQLTRLFRERFPAWADQYIQQAQTDTNMPPFTAEDKAKIEKIAEHADKLQAEVVEKKPPETERRVLQEQALKDLLEIRELLPKQPNQQQQQQQQQQQDQQQQNQEQQQQEQQQEQEQQQQEQQPEPQEQKPEPPQDVQELLRKALEREKEHEEEKKERMRKMPMVPGERDW
ncbi:MAG: VWA domain-containing protein [Kiritimatiellae bacterium]|nr:VWA domain-containing protein [Kiritimatiellia bacterium]